MCPRPFSRSVVTVSLGVVMTLGSGCAVSVPPRLMPGAAPLASLPRELKVRVSGRIVNVAFEDYVAGSAISEVSPTGETAATVDRVLDVQTIVARTYALAHLGRHRADGFDVCDSTHCQLYEPARMGSSRFAADVRRAIARTAGTVLAYGGRPIDAVFHADCGGHTASPDQVWGTSPLPYLPSEPDRVPALTHRSWTVTLTREQVRAALNADARNAVGRTLTSVEASQTDDSGRISRVLVSGDRRIELSGDDFRTLLGKSLGPKGLPSTRFRVQSSRSGFVMTGTGYGHGVGLCQLGAMARARRNTPVATILASYFPGATLLKPGGRIP